MVEEGEEEKHMLEERKVRCILAGLEENEN